MPSVTAFDVKTKKKSKLNVTSVTKKGTSHFAMGTFGHGGKGSLIISAANAKSLRSKMKK